MSSSGPPRREYYIRQNYLADLVGPLDFRQAVYSARRLSQEEDNLDGTAEIVTYVGARIGDPKMTPVLQTVFLYVRGRRLFGQQLANYNAQKFVGLKIGTII